MMWFIGPRGRTVIVVKCSDLTAFEKWQKLAFCQHSDRVALGSYRLSSGKILGSGIQTNRNSNNLEFRINAIPKGFQLSC